MQLIELENRPDLAGLAERFPERYPVLLKSSSSGGSLGRFDILLAASGQPLVKFPGKKLSGPADAIAQGGDFLAALQGWIGTVECLTPVVDLPFIGGWFVYLGYEMAAAVEPTLRLPQFDPDFPDAIAWRAPVAAIYDHTLNRASVIAEPGAESIASQLLADLDNAARKPEEGTFECAKWQVDSPSVYAGHVEKIRNYIDAGDVFQVNVSRQWSCHYLGSERALFDRLCELNPAPFAGWVRTPWGDIVSSSPERLVEVRGRTAQTRPIAGTRPRSSDPETDANLSAELIGHPKERAEHIMLIDLERNDLGRVCVPGSVRVDELMAIESYAHVHHIVSNVRGRLREEVSPVDVLRAVFPGGTITGCPKVRCMEIIAELEGVGRGPYTGSFGYINRDGSMDMNILIRTLFARDGHIQFRAGGGIVADSERGREVAETEAKAEGIVRALKS